MPKAGMSETAASVRIGARHDALGISSWERIRWTRDGKLRPIRTKRIQGSRAFLANFIQHRRRGETADIFGNYGVMEGKTSVLPSMIENCRVACQAESSFRTISAPAPKAFNLPRATSRGKGAIPQLVQG